MKKEYSLENNTTQEVTFVSSEWTASLLVLPSDMLSFTYLLLTFSRVWATFQTFSCTCSLSSWFSHSVFFHFCLGRWSRMENRIWGLQSKWLSWTQLWKTSPFLIQEIPAELADPQALPFFLTTVSVNDVLDYLDGLRYCLMNSYMCPDEYWIHLLMPLFHTAFYVYCMCRSHPVDNAGFLSFTTFAWMTPMMWSIFRNKLDISTLQLSPFDVADTSGERSFLFRFHYCNECSHRICPDC